MNRANLSQIFDSSLPSLEVVISTNGEKELFARSKSKWMLYSAFLVPETGIPGSSRTAEESPTGEIVS